MSEPAAVLAGQLDVDEALALVAYDDRAPAAAAVTGELVAPVEELADAFVLTLVASAQTQRTYQRACRRFVRWLGPLAGPEALTAANLAHYTPTWSRAAARARPCARTARRSTASCAGWSSTSGCRPQRSARRSRSGCHARSAPSASRPRRSPQPSMSGCCARPRRGSPTTRWPARALAIVRVLGDAGLRCEELARLQRRDFLPARQGATLRALDVRHGKGDRQRRVVLSTAATRAIVRWDRERAHALGPPADDAPLFITLGTRRRDGSYARVGGPCGQGVLAELLKRLGAAAELPDELRHPHALRHTCATELLRAGASIADVRTFLGHASVKTTSIYLASSEQRQEWAVQQRERGRVTLDEDRDAG